MFNTDKFEKKGDLFRVQYSAKCNWCSERVVGFVSESEDEDEARTDAFNMTLAECTQRGWVHKTIYGIYGDTYEVMACSRHKQKT